MVMIAESRRKKAASRIETTVSVMAYLKPRSATLVVYIPRNPGVPAVRSRRSVAARILGDPRVRVRKRWQIGRTEGVSARVPFELVAPLLVGCNRLVAHGAVDPLFREAYRRNEEVRAELYRRALERMHYDREAAEAYIRAWLKSDRYFELPPDDPDAYRASMANPSVVWSFGRRRYIVHVPPWA
jgi:hypothetical protein